MTFSLDGLVLTNYEKNTNESLLCRYHSLSLHGKKTKGTCNNSTSLNRISINYTSLPNTTTMNSKKKTLYKGNKHTLLSIMLCFKVKVRHYYSQVHFKSEYFVNSLSNLKYFDNTSSIYC